MNVLVLTKALVGSRMASPGIRAYHMARVLGDSLDDANITLGVPDAGDLLDGDLPFNIQTYGSSQREIRRLVRDADIVITGHAPPYLFPSLRSKRLVLDLYSPYVPEWLSISRVVRRMGYRRAWMETNRRYLGMQLAAADYILCANDRQRDLYVGMLASFGLLTPQVYDKDKELGHLLGVVPYGVRPGSPAASRRVLKGVHPGIGEDDKVLLWNGTLIEWYDVDTLLQSMQLLQSQRPDIKLFFMGTEYPTLQAKSKAAQSLGGGAVLEAVDRSKELGLLDSTVFFNFDWIDYDDTANYLLEADAGVCTHFEGIEADYAFRTRYVDLFWAQTPIVCTRGDVLAGLVDDRPLGVAVPPADPQALADAILKTVDDEAFIATCKENLATVREEYRWERVMQPLVAYCREAAQPEAERPQKHTGQLARSTVSYGRARIYQLIYFLITTNFDKLRRRLRGQPPAQ